MVKSRGTKIVDLLLAFICLFVILACLLPMLNLLSRSLSSTEALQFGKVSLLPVKYIRETKEYVTGIDFSAYKLVLTDPSGLYIRALIWTALLTVICTLLSLTMTALCAFPLIYPQLKLKRAHNTIIIFTMYFSAGTIPSYILYQSLNLVDNPLVLILPGCLSVFNMIIMRSFFYGIPESLRESAEIDGAGPIRTLINIYLPLSTPVLATLALFYAVGRWNGYSDALMFMNKNRPFYPIQYLLYNLLQGIQGVDTTMDSSATSSPATLKAAAVMFATIPILIIYPFLQRYFIAGATLGAVKE